MSEKIWLLTQGCYSDYRVVGVYSRKEDAERVACALVGEVDFGEDINVEEQSLNPGLDNINQGLTPYTVYMEWDGDSRVSTSPSRLDCARHIDIKAHGGGIICYAWARSKEHAAKIANERRVKLLAEGAMRSKP